MTRVHAVLIIAALIMGVAGCKREEPAKGAAVSVAKISLGNTLGPDKKVTTASDTFGKSDTIYAAVETTGSGNAMLTARWTYHSGDKPAQVSASSQTFIASGPAVTDFQISMPDGLPRGDYRVEISLNNKSVGTRKFVVK